MLTLFASNKFKSSTTSSLPPTKLKLVVFPLHFPAKKNFKNPITPKPAKASSFSSIIATSNTLKKNKTFLIIVEVNESFIFLLIFFSSSIFSITIALKPDYPSLNCGHDGAPDIRFPFRIKGHQQQPQRNCPSFELVCKGNDTIIHFPSYGRDLIVKSISYDTRKLNLLDPKNCVHEVFLNLNLSSPSLHHYYVVKNYTYLNCSSELSPPFVQVPCLSCFGHHIYTVESSFVTPDSCRVIKTVAIPFSYSPYLSDNSFGLDSLGICLNLKIVKQSSLKLDFNQDFLMQLLLLDFRISL